MPGTPELLSCRLAMLDPARDLRAAGAVVIARARRVRGEQAELDVWICAACADGTGLQTALRLPGTVLPVYA
jgi:hypothetical protein